MKKNNIIRLFLLIFTLSPIINSHGEEYEIKFKIIIRNNHNYPLPISFLKGQLFETINYLNNPQNIVLKEDVHIILGPNEVREVQLVGYCTNYAHNEPKQEPLVPTPFNINPNRFNSQEDVWRFLQSK